MAANRNLALNLLIKAKDLAGNVVRGFRKDLDQSGAAADRLGDELQDTSKDAKTLTGRVGELGIKLKGILLGGAIAAGLKSLFSGALGSSARFERQMNRVEAATNATADDMRLLTEAAEEAGSTTEFTATQAAEGLEILGRAGFSAKESVELLPSVLSVATAEGVGLAEASGMISDTLSVMQMEIAKGARATDILARGSSLANTRMLELGNAISYSGSFAREADLDLELLVAVLDVLAKNGLRGERAGTGLRSVLAQLADPASKASKAVAQLGIPTDNFIQMIEGLRQKGPEATKAINAFGIEAGPALRALIAEGAEGIRQFEEQLRSAEGAAKQMADTASDDLIGSAKGFQSAWDSLRKTLSNPLLEPFAGLLDQVADKFREMKEAGNLQVWGEITAVAVNRVAGALQIIYNTATFASKAIGTFVAQIATWVTSAELQIGKLMNRVGLISDKTVKGLEIQAGATRAVLDAMVEEAEQDLRDMGDGWDLLSGKITLGQQKAGAAAAAAGEQAKTAAKATGEAAGEVAEAGDQAASALAIATQKIVDEFTNARDEGKTTADALDKAFAAVDLTTTEGITALGNALTEISEQAEGLDTQLQAGLAKTLAKMSVDELEAFRQKAIAAFADASNGAATLDRLLNGALDASLRQLGVDIEKLRTGITTVGGNAIQAFDIVRKELERTGTTGKEASDTIEAAFEAAFDKITTKAGLDKLKASLKAAAKEGQISWAEYRTELQRIKEKYGELEMAAKQSVDGQKKSLGDLKKEAKDAASSIEDAYSKASSGKSGSGASASGDSTPTAYHSMSSRVAEQLKAQGRSDAAEILMKNIASGKVPNELNIGLKGWNRWWDSVKKQALDEADAIQAKYDELARYQRDIAAGDVAAAQQLLQRRNAFADLEADLTGIISSAAALVNNQPTQRPGQQVQPPQAGVVTVRFDFNGRQIPAQFTPSNVEAFLDEIADVARVSR